MKLIKRILLLLVAMLVITGIAAYWVVFSANVTVEKEDYLYYRKGDSLLLSLQPFIKNQATFALLAGKMKVNNQIPSGKYIIKQGMSNLDLCRMLRTGNSADIVIKLKAEMSRDSLINYLSHSLGFPSDSLRSAMQHFADTSAEFNRESIYCLFLPDHYFFKWGRGIQNTLSRFNREYQRFWTKKRQSAADSLGMSKTEVEILATLVDGEAIYRSEMPRIAGLYLNRLKKGMPLQADPAIIFMIADENRRRVLFADLERQDPYNTYLNTGLPPGPIMLPDKFAIDAVLHAEQHEFIFMCARADGSNRHEFTSDYKVHLKNAMLYRRFLDRSNTMR